MNRVITQRGLIRDVAQRWAKAYWNSDSQKHADIFKALCALDPETATPEDVRQVIGHDSWTSFRCNECDSWDVPAVRTCGETPDYESANADLCLACLKKAVAELEAAQ